jgi:hypothetical protein
MTPFAFDMVLFYSLWVTLLLLVRAALDVLRRGR